MARGPDGAGGGKGSSLADQLFNEESIGDLAAEFSVLPGFDASRFLEVCVPGLAARGLMERLEWIADCLEAQLPAGFAAMADALEAAMPAPLDASRKDDDFGRFIHAVHGVLIARHGLEQPERALDALYAATQRFSMEYAIRPYLNRWPEETLARMEDWARDDHYHVRRLVSEGTRPKLPWGRKVEIDPLRPLALLDVLHADPTRFVTRSVANHLNDLSKIAPEAVVGRLRDWKAQGAQEARELDWMTRHALRTAVKRGEGPALALLGYEGGRVRARLEVLTPEVAIGGVLEFAVTLEAEARLPVMVDYRLRYARPKGTAEKVFKLKVAEVRPGGALRLTKRQRLLGDATTYKLHPGVHGITVQVNGEDVAEGGFDLVSGP